MRNASGEAAHRLHLLRLAQRLLRGFEFDFPSFGQAKVTPDGDEVYTVGFGCHGPLDVLPAAIASGYAVLKTARPPGLGHAPDRLKRGGHVIGMHERGVATGEQLGSVPAQDVRPRRTDGRHHAAIVGPGEHVLGQVHQAVALRRACGHLRLQRIVQFAELGFAVAQFRFGSQPLSGREGAFGDFPDQDKLLAGPGPDRGMVDVENRAQAASLDHRNVDERSRTAALQRRRRRRGSFVLAHVWDRDELAALQALDE